MSVAFRPSPHAPIDVVAVVDASPLGRLQVTTFVLATLCLVLDGFDVQSMGYVAPAVIADWHVAKAALGPVFGAGLTGMLVGSLVLSVVADRIGRRPVLIGATMAFGLCMIATGQVASIRELLWLRFATGLGLGAIMPNALALAGEYAPARMRVTVMMVVSCGFTVGAVVGGFVSIALVTSYGWRSVFWCGGLAPLLLAIVMLVSLPESMQLLIGQQRGVGRVRRWLAAIDGGRTPDADTMFVVSERPRRTLSAVALFAEGRAKVTLVLWAVSFLNLINLYFLANWLPTLVSSVGYSPAAAILAGTMLQVGGAIGTLAMSRLIERRGFGRVLVTAFLVGAATIAMIGLPGIGGGPMFAAIVVAGFCVVGGQPAVNALAASVYPTPLRATGIGWSLGIGRFGSIVGPVVAGALVGLDWSNTSLFLVASVPALLSAALMLGLGNRRFPRAASDPAHAH